MAKAEKKSNPPRGADLAELRGALHALEESVVREVVKDACDRVHDLVVSTLSDITAKRVAVSDNGSAESTQARSSEWKKIGSLSEIRRLVGGRFQNLKNRWVGAGFPLREHRGDRGGQFDIVGKGWEEFHAWLLQQGFESRLSEEADGTLFEIRMLK